MGVLAILFLTARAPAPTPTVRPALSRVEGPTQRAAAQHPGARPAAVPKPAVAPAAVPAPRPPAPAPAPFPAGRGRIAIVLDDWGYSMSQVPELRAIRAPLTVAVLPGLPHSADVAREAAGRGHEVILHMPMEAVNPDEPREEGRTLLKGMARSEILELLDRSLATVPLAEGISNHQGSKVTSDPGSMEVVLRETKRRGLYFLDSLVTSRSVCAEVARKVKVRFAQRAVFLDNEESAPRIRERLVELAQAAAEKGAAVGIGHDRPVTVEVLRRAVPQLEEAGYTLVAVSELAEEQ
ncbi:MAG: divergent polysaccharide deacetylase family protein [Candidatus Omnitrophica bacterium]|nr:divergent polysaccharide deacetylase family protein [Candidatus Omnitrophota bacterium]